MGSTYGGEKRGEVRRVMGTTYVEERRGQKTRGG
jgi:hypothetical protein